MRPFNRNSCKLAVDGAFLSVLLEQQSVIRLQEVTDMKTTGVDRHPRGRRKVMDKHSKPLSPTGGRVDNPEEIFKQRELVRTLQSWFIDHWPIPETTMMSTNVANEIKALHPNHQHCSA